MITWTYQGRPCRSLSPTHITAGRAGRGAGQPEAGTSWDPRASPPQPFRLLLGGECVRPCDQPPTAPVGDRICPPAVVLTHGAGGAHCVSGASTSVGLGRSHVHRVAPGGRLAASEPAMGALCAAFSSGLGGTVASFTYYRKPLAEGRSPPHLDGQTDELDQP